MYTWPYFLHLFLKTQKLKRNKLWNRFADTIHSYSVMQFCWTLHTLWLLVCFLDIPYVWKLTEYTRAAIHCNTTHPHSCCCSSRTMPSISFLSLSFSSLREDSSDCIFASCVSLTQSILPFYNTHIHRVAKVFLYRANDLLHREPQWNIPQWSENLLLRLLLIKGVLHSEPGHKYSGNYSSEPP